MRILRQSIFNTIIKNGLGDECVNGWSEEVYLRSFQVLLKHVMHIDCWEKTKTEFRKLDTTITPAMLLNLRSVITCRYECVALKISLLQAYKIRKNISRNDAYNLIEANDLYDTDVDLLLNLFKAGIEGILKTATKSIKTKELYSFEEIRKQSGKEVLSLRKNVRYFVFSKMKFIATQNNTPLVDYENEIEEHLINTFYWISPFYSEAHRTNYLKQTIHNFGNKRITFYNRLKRQRMINNNGKFILTVDCFSNIESGTRMDSGSDGTLTKFDSDTKVDCLQDRNSDIGAVYNPIEDFHRSKVIQSYVSKGGIHRKHIVGLLSLSYGKEEFVKFCKTKMSLRAITECEEVYDRVGDETYLKMIAEYLQIPDELVHNTRQELKSLLLDENP